MTTAFSDLWHRRLGLVVAPAGWGKSTLLTQVAMTVDDARVAWYSAEDFDGAARNLIARLGDVITGAGPDADGHRETVEDVVAAVSASPGRILFVVDNLHELEGTPAETVLGRLVQAAPRNLAVLAASRTVPGWNLSRWRVGNELVELTGDDLRFRSWEVERLFREHYGSPLAPEHLAALSRLTEGWAAGLQLFHLASENKPVAERRRLIASLGSGFRLMREYLLENVLDELPAELRTFLADTCVLGCLRGPLCDELRGTKGSHALLEELERRQLVTASYGGLPWYRCHEVLRSHLETSYLETVSDGEARARFRWAASLLESGGAVSDALRAYCRAEDWEEAARLLGHKGEELSEEPLAWGSFLPPSLARHDPWILLSEARRHRADGRWREAIVAYQEAEHAMQSSGAAETCRRERATLSAWMDSGPWPVSDWLGLLRSALTRDPMVVVHEEADSRDARRRLVAGLAALAAGMPALAVAPLSAAAQAPDGSPALAAVAEFALAAVGVLGGTGSSGAAQAAEQLEVLRIGALTRFVATIASLPTQESVVEAAEVRATCMAVGDTWGAAVAALFEAWAALHATGVEGTSRAIDSAAAAVAGFHALGAPVLVVLAESLAALAGVRSSHPDAASKARQAEAYSRALGVPGAQAVAIRALAESGEEPGAGLEVLAEELARRCGLALPRAGDAPVLTAGPTGDEPPAGASITIRCFRRFSVAVRGDVADLSPLKPRARRVLRILATYCPDWVHREVLIDAVWPSADHLTGTRNLHVAVSSLRHVLEPDSARGGSLIVREGEAYRLALPDDGWVDHIELERALASARRARIAGETVSLRRALAVALDLAAGPLLPEDGPDDWVLPKRDRYRAEVCRAAEELAGLLVDAGENQAAVAVCDQGLAVDRWSDPLWRLLAEAHSGAGDLAAAARAKRDYAALLTELGVTPESHRPDTPATSGK